MAIDPTQIKDMSVAEAAKLIGEFRTEELSGENRADAIDALIEIFTHIVRDINTDGANDWIERFIPKFKEINAEMQTGEKPGDNPPPSDTPEPQDNSATSVSDNTPTPQPNAANAQLDSVFQQMNGAF